MKKCAYVKWRENAKNLTESYKGHFENLKEPYSKENKTLQILTQHLCQVVVTLITPVPPGTKGGGENFFLNFWPSRIFFLR